MNKLLFSTFAPTTQLDVTHHQLSGNKLWTFASERITSVPSILLIKVSPVVTSRLMPIPLDFSPKTPPESVSSNPSPRTSVSMVRELVAYHSWLILPKKPPESNPESRQLPDQCTPTHQCTELELLIIFSAMPTWPPTGIKSLSTCLQECSQWERLLEVAWSPLDLLITGST